MRDRKGRYSARCKRATVLRLLMSVGSQVGDAGVGHHCGADLAVATYTFLAAGQAGLETVGRPMAVDDDHRRLQAKIGELNGVEVELPYAKVDQLESERPLAGRRSTQ